MKIGGSRRGTLVPALVAFMVLAGVGVSLAGRPDPVPDPGPPVNQVRSGHRSDDGSHRSPTTPGEDPTDPSVTDEVPSVCAEALDAGNAALDDARGLDRAIEVILESCGRNPAAQGQLNALERLRENQGRKDAKDHGGTPNANANDHATADNSSNAVHDEPKDPSPSSSRGQGDDHANASAGKDAAAA